MAQRLLSMTPEELSQKLESPTRARAVFRCLSQGLDPWTDGNLPAGLRRRLKGVCTHQLPPPLRVDRAGDGTTKLLLEVEGEKDSARVETVLIPQLQGRRTTLCVSSQQGCIRGCSFCLTATMGLAQNLSAQAIVAQVYAGLAVRLHEGLPPLRNLVFMGMGEPLDNWHQVRRALSILTDPRGFGFGPRHVTVSTVGPSPRAIARLRDCPTKIAWSLHAARQEVRPSLVPTQRHSVEALREAFRDVFEYRRDPLFVEMTLISGVNDAEKDAEATLALFEGFPAEVRFNLLPVNPTGRGQAPSSRTKVEAFASILRTGGHFVMARKARGADRKSACGQLAVKIGRPQP